VRRTILALAGSLISVAILIGLKSAPTASLLGWSPDSEHPPGDTSTGDGTDPATGDPALVPASGAPSNGAGVTPGPSASRSPGAPTSAPGPSTSTATAPPATSTTVTGAAIAVRTAQSPTTKSSSCGECANYTISVTVTVSGGKITKAAVTYNSSPGGSQSYANSANSKLSQTILTAQTWNLGRVSGATYAGNAWELSVKDAMSKAGLPV
jgi:uncharacterized protein with FMN-binding domain